MPKIKFEKTLLIGSGTIPWYMKAKRWAKKQKFPISFLLLGAIEWLKNFWIDVKIYNNMRDIDRQAEALKKHWEEHDEPTTPHVVETGVFGDEGWSIEISNPVVERGSSAVNSDLGSNENLDQIRNLEILFE